MKGGRELNYFSRFLNVFIVLKSVPGGFNALERIYRELEEPMLNATRDQFSQNPFAALMNNNQASENSMNLI